MNQQIAYQSGHNNVIVQAGGDNISIQVGPPHLKLVPVGALLRGTPRREIDLLNPSFQAIPFVGRENDLRALKDWLTSDSRIAATVIIGSGGAGKTRFSYQLLQDLSAGWQGGFLERSEAERFISQRNLSEWLWQTDTLIVVDYASMMADTLKKWFSELANCINSKHRLRILLLERHADPNGGWYHDLADGTWGGKAIGDALSFRAPIQLAPITDSTHRKSLLAAARDAARAFHGYGEIVQLPEFGEDHWFDKQLASSEWKDPLVLLMAGIVMASSSQSAWSLSRLELATELAKRELDRIRRVAPSKATGEILCHLYACATLCGGLVRSDATRVIELELIDQHKGYPGGSGQAVEDLENILGTKREIAPLTPDLIGECTVKLALGAEGSAVLGRLAPMAAEGIVSTLIRSAQDFGPAGEVWPTEWLNAIVAMRDWKVLAIIQGALPAYTSVLKALAADVAQLLLERRLQHPGPENPIEEGFIGELWATLASRQLGVGRFTEALVSANNAVGIHRGVAIVDDEVGPMLLAVTLNILTMVLAARGQHSEALPAISEAAEIKRELSKSAPKLHIRDLAIMLNNQGSCQLAIGQADEALDSFTEAVGIHRTFAENEPGEASFNLLAGSLTNQTGAFIRLRRNAEALESISESIRLRRILDHTNPDSFRSELAGSLLAQGAVQQAIGSPDDAVASDSEAVTLFRSFSEKESRDSLPELARALDNLGHAQHDAGLHAEALASVSEAVDINRRLADEHPGAFTSNLAHSLHNQANARHDLGQQIDAIASLSECIELHSKLANENSAAYGAVLFQSLNVLSGWYTMRGEICLALRALTKSFVAISPLVASQPLKYDDDLEGPLVWYLFFCTQLGLQPDEGLIGPLIPALVRKDLWRISQISRTNS